MHRAPASWLALLVLLAVAMSGCARDYTSRMNVVLAAVHQQQLPTALDEITALIERGAEGRKPESKNLTLLLLERASIYQSLGEHELALRDLRDADQMLEILDLTPQGARNAARYLFSDSATVYHAPIYEKLMVNVAALCSYLHLGNISAANVEARRIAVLGQYFRNAGYEDHPMLGVAWYLAGIASELGGQTGTARRFYQDAINTGDTRGARQALDRLTGAQPRHEQELIVIVLSGTGPTKRAERFPLGIALGWVNDDFPLGREETNIIGGLSAEELLNWVNFPVLEVSPPGWVRWEARIDGRATDVPHLASLTEFALQQWEELRPAIAMSAISRAVTRMATSAAFRGGAMAARSSGSTGGQIAGGLLRLGGLIAQGAMQANDIPDTRAWNTIAGDVFVERIRVHAGVQRVSITGTGRAGTYAVTETVDIPAGGRAVVVVRALD